MSLKTHALALALAAMIAAPAPAFAIGGGPGCSNLPEYDRAVGALQGLSTCDMTIEEANRIVYGRAAPAAAGQAAPRRHRHHRVRAVQPY